MKPYIQKVTNNFSNKITRNVACEFSGLDNHMFGTKCTHWSLTVYWSLLYCFRNILARALLQKNLSCWVRVRARPPKLWRINFLYYIFILLWLLECFFISNAFSNFCYICIFFLFIIFYFSYTKSDFLFLHHKISKSKHYYAVEG